MTKRRQRRKSRKPPIKQADRSSSQLVPTKSPSAWKVLVTALGIGGPIVTELLGDTVWFWSAAGLAVVASAAFWLEINRPEAIASWRRTRRLPRGVLWRLCIPFLVMIAILLSWTKVSARLDEEKRQKLVAEQRGEELEQRFELAMEAVSGVSYPQKCKLDEAQSSGSVVLSVNRAGQNVNYVKVTQDFPGACQVYLSETGARDGQLLQIVNSSDGVLILKSVRSVLELVSDATLQRGEAITLRYAQDRWLEVQRLIAGERLDDLAQHLPVQ